jgi:hypothetical protein
MVHHRQRLALLLEARDHALRIHASLDDPQRDALHERLAPMVEPAGDPIGIVEPTSPGGAPPESIGMVRKDSMGGVGVGSVMRRDSDDEMTVTRFPQACARPKPETSPIHDLAASARG